MWQIYDGTTLCYWQESRDVACTLCPLLCETFPVRHVVHWGPLHIPCLTEEQVLEILEARAPPGSSEANHLRNCLTDELVKLLWTIGASRYCMYPSPTFDKEGRVAVFGDHFERMGLLLSKGADVKDPRIRQALVTKGFTPPSTADFTDIIDFVHDFGWNDGCDKRFLKLSDFRQMVRMGFDITADDFYLVDFNDERTVPPRRR